MHKLITASFSVLAFVLVVLVLVPAGLLTHWAIDRTMPIQRLTGQFLKWESKKPYVAMIQWTAHRKRLCIGQTTSWVYAGKPIELSPVVLPYKDAAHPMGEGLVKWTEMINIPDEAFLTEEDHILLNIHFVWRCNPLQDYWPLEHDAPLIRIPISNLR